MKPSHDTEKEEYAAKNKRTFTEAEAPFHAAQWMGAIIFYLLYRGKRPFSELYVAPYRRRNLRIGYALNVLVLTGLVCLLIWLKE